MKQKFNSETTNAILRPVEEVVQIKGTSNWKITAAKLGHIEEGHLNESYVKYGDNHWKTPIELKRGRIKRNHISDIDDARFSWVAWTTQMKGMADFGNEVEYNAMLILT